MNNIDRNIKTAFSGFALAFALTTMLMAIYYKVNIVLGIFTIVTFVLVLGMYVCNLKSFEY